MTFVFTFAGALSGLFLRFMLPDNHLNDDARDVVKLGAGLIATMAALILGLLINSAHNSLDTINNELTQTGTTIVELDQTLASYGPETAELRGLLRKCVDAAIESRGLENVVKEETTERFDIEKALRKMQSKLRSMSPQNNAQTILRSQAYQEVKQLTHSRLLLLGRGHKRISGIFLIVLIFWLVVIFVSFGLLAPHNWTVIGVLFVCAVSVSAAIFILTAMNNPYKGFFSVSSAPLRSALEQLGKQ
jgi:Protein of unknown function (DUF4239)